MSAPSQVAIPSFGFEWTLARYFSKQASLGGHLVSIFACPIRLSYNDDPPEYLDLLSKTKVCLDDGYKERSWDHIQPPRVTMSEMLDLAMNQIFDKNKDKTRPLNLLTRGWVQSAWSVEMETGLKPFKAPLRNYIFTAYGNDNHTLFHSSSWELLSQRIGQPAFIHLLSYASIFVPLANQCYSQITGTPLADLHPLPPIVATSPPPKRAREDSQEVPRKRRKLKKRDKIAVSKALPQDGGEDVEMTDVKALEATFAAPRDHLASRKAIVSKSKTSADIVIARGCMFYGRARREPKEVSSVLPAKASKSKSILVGLPPKNVLRRLAPAGLATATAAAAPDTSSRLSPADVKTLAMHIFPRQFKLPNVFTTSTAALKTEYGSSRLDYTDLTFIIDTERRKRKEGIKSGGRMKSPRLKELLEEIWRRYRKVDWWKLRAICCPSHVKKKTKKKSKPALQGSAGSVLKKRFTLVEPELPLEFYSHERPPSTQSHVAIPASSIEQLPITQEAVPEISESELYLPHSAPAEKEPPSATTMKLRFGDYAQAHGQVSRFAKNAIKLVIPLEFFGSSLNRLLVLRGVDKFIRLRRFESLTLHSILQHFCITECDWLRPDGLEPGARVTPGDAIKREELLREFLFWLFESFLIPLIKTQFYVTESAAFKTQVLYFRQDDWYLLCRSQLRHLRKNHFKKLSETEVASTVGKKEGLFGFSYVRLLPKLAGIRPLMNLKRKPKVPPGTSPYSPQVKSINQQLEGSLDVLNYQRRTKTELFGSSILSADGIYPKIKQFKLVTAPDGEKPPPYYFVKVDVRSCFDTMNQEKLIEVLQEVLKEGVNYEIMHYNVIKASRGGGIRKCFLHDAFAKGEKPSFPKLADIVAAKSPRQILANRAWFKKLSREELFGLLEEHVKRNIVKIGKDYFRQKSGIPQGSNLSTHLCSFFYAHMEKKHLGFTKSPDCMLVRLVDDFLLVTTDVAKATRFLRTMHAGNEAYGCHVSTEKTLINFECRLLHEDSPLVASTTDFPWCGHFIDTRYLYIKGDYTRDTHHIANSVTVSSCRHPGEQLREKTFKLLSLKKSICFHDTGHNSLDVVYLNIYQNVAHCAMKTVVYLKELGYHDERQSKFVLDLINTAARYSYKMNQKSASTEAALALGARVDTDEKTVIWLAKYSFLNVLRPKIALFPRVVQALEADVTARGAGVKTVKDVRRGNAGKPNRSSATLEEKHALLLKRAWEGLNSLRY